MCFILPPPLEFVDNAGIVQAIIFVRLDYVKAYLSFNVQVVYYQTGYRTRKLVRYIWYSPQV